MKKDKEWFKKQIKEEEIDLKYAFDNYVPYEKVLIADDVNELLAQLEETEQKTKNKEDNKVKSLDNNKLENKHKKATKKVAELVKENKTLKQTVLLTEENQRQKEKMWRKRNVELSEMLYRLEDKIAEQPDTRLLETERYTYKVQKEEIEKELKETQEDNLIYSDILSTVFNDVEEIVDIYMQGRRRGQLDE